MRRYIHGALSPSVKKGSGGSSLFRDGRCPKPPGRSLESGRKAWRRSCRPVRPTAVAVQAGWSADLPPCAAEAFSNGEDPRRPTKLARPSRRVRRPTAVRFLEPRREGPGPSPGPRYTVERNGRARHRRRSSGGPIGEATQTNFDRLRFISRACRGGGNSAEGDYSRVTIPERPGSFKKCLGRGRWVRAIFTCIHNDRPSADPKGRATVVSQGVKVAQKPPARSRNRHGARARGSPKGRSTVGRDEDGQVARVATW